MQKQLRVLLCDGVDPVVEATLRRELPHLDLHVERRPQGLPRDPEARQELLRTVHVIGVRSQTQLTADLLHPAVTGNLLAIGCFCIGTDQVDLAAAAARGIPVFNAPFASTRSVAEWVVAQMINLSRRLGEQNAALHRGSWHKSARGCREVRGKTLGIVGYGNVGAQVSVLAEALGMRVRYYDIRPVLPLGAAAAVPTLEALLGEADLLTLHVPLTAHTHHLIGARELSLLKPGALLLNAARGPVVDVDALANALTRGHLGGAAVDVFPHEPAGSTCNDFQSSLRGCPNTMLSAHVGGSTEEAQTRIGVDVAMKWVQLLRSASTVAAVNVPRVALHDVPEPGYREAGLPGRWRVGVMHRNAPRARDQIGDALRHACPDLNIVEERLRTQEALGYVVMDVDFSLAAAAAAGGLLVPRPDGDVIAAVKAQLEACPVVVRVMTTWT